MLTRSGQRQLKKGFTILVLFTFLIGILGSLNSSFSDRGSRGAAVAASDHGTANGGDGNNGDELKILGCKDFHSFHFDEDAPFTHGHSRGVYHARYRHQDMVVKRPIGPYLKEKLSTAEVTFQREIDKISTFQGHPSIVKLYGWCLDPSSEGGLWTAGEHLLPFHHFLERPLPWCSLVHSAITIMSLLDLLNGNWTPADPHAGGWIHCDFSPGAIAFTGNGEAKLVDFGGLAPRSSFPVESVLCTGHDKAECSQGFCMRSWSKLVHLDEFTCSSRTGQCTGFDPRAMTGVFGGAVLPRLLDPALLADRGARNTSAVKPVLQGASSHDRKKRWSPTAVGNALREYLFYNNGFSCLRRANVQLDSCHYLERYRVTAATLALSKSRRTLVHAPRLDKIIFEDPYNV